MSPQTIELISHFGLMTSITIMGVVWFGLLTIVKFQWTCGQCGKLNTTSFIKWALQWCDHFGHGA